MRNGDFSELLSQGIIIYDPLTAQTVGARVVRQPFPGNIIPADRINAIAKNVLSYYPLPNETAQRIAAGQLRLRESAHGHVQLAVFPGRPLDHPEAADVRALHAQRSTGVP